MAFPAIADVEDTEYDTATASPHSAAIQFPGSKRDADDVLSKRARPIEELMQRVAIACFWQDIGWHGLLSLRDPSEFLFTHCQINDRERVLVFRHIRDRLNQATLSQTQEPGHA